jgi:hypothetical protein
LIILKCVAPDGTLIKLAGLNEGIVKTLSFLSTLGVNV